MQAAFLNIHAVAGTFTFEQMDPNRAYSFELNALTLKETCCCLGQY